MILTRLRYALLGALLGMTAGILVSAAGFLIWQRAGAPGSAPSRIVDPPGLVKEIRQLKELVSVKYTVQKVVGLEEKKVPFGSEKILLIVQAEVLAGADLAQLEARDVEAPPGGGVRVALPPAKILHIVIDDQQTKVWDRRITWWTPWVPYNQDLERQARLAARESIEAAAIGMGILEQARRNAEAAVRHLLMALGAESVMFASGT